MTDGLKDKHREAMIDILSSSERVERVALFGSRAMGTFTATSDVDIVLYGDKLTPTDRSKLAAAIDELSMPQQVDLLLYKSIKKRELLEHIKAHGVEWWRRSWAVWGDWKKFFLGQLYEFRSGLSKPRSAFGSGYPFLSFKDVFYNSAVPELHELVNSTDSERRNCSIKRGDVFLTRTSEIMEELGMSSVALRDIPNATFNGFTKRLRPKNAESVLPEYARYYFLSPEFRQEVTAMSSLSTRASLNNEMLGRLSITVPPWDEQRAIAHTLGSLDDKIELNRRMNQTLEATVRAIFKSWFVDFDPVRAKVEGRPTGLPDDIAELFPDSFEDSELGDIPRGWAVKPIGQAVKCVGGSTPSTKNPAFWDGGKNPFVTPKDMSSLTSPVVLDTSRHITDAGVDKISSGRLPIGTVILSSRAPIGYLAITEVSVSVNQTVIAMICNKNLPNHYVLYWTETNMETIKSNAGGTTFAEISKRNFRPILVVVPQKLVLDAFVQQVEPLRKQVVLNLKQSNSLTSIRDTLLPKLISGELHVPDAEKFVEEAGL